MLTEKKDVYKVEVVIKTASVNLDNVEIKFNSLTMRNEDEEDEIVFAGRQYEVGRERCSDGVKASIYIVNDGTTVQERMDWLIDEEYLISSINIEATKISTGETLEYELISPFGEQTVREMKIAVSDKLEKTVTFFTDRLTDGNQVLGDLLLKTLKSDECIQDMIEKVMNITVA